MADIRAILQAEGLSEEEITTLTSNPKYTGALNKLVANSEAGETALQNARKIEEDLKKFNDETVIPYGLKKDKEAAQARAEAAKYQTYLKSLKESGYEIPDEYISAAPPEGAKPPERQQEPSGKYVGSEDLDKQGRAYMSLLSMSERARDLLGHGLDVEAEYEDFGKNRRPSETLRTYISRKYDLDAKSAAKEEERKATERKKIEDEAIEKYKAEHPTSANPETGSPRPTKFDRLANLDQERKQLWQTAEGRDKATKDRIAKYSQVQ